MARVPLAVDTLAGRNFTPQEVRSLRKASIEFHQNFGQLVIHKHRWNAKDLEEGRATKCPLHDEVYGQDAYDDYCFGTGYAGGFADGVMTYVTIADTQEDVIKPNQYGVLVHQRHPGMVAPWIPEMGDGDMIIIALFDQTLNITETGDRYLLREVTPVSMRGPGYPNMVGMKPYRVNQEAMIDELPRGHGFYEVPLTFDYSTLPDPVTPGTPAGYKTTHFEIGIRMIAEPKRIGKVTSEEHEVRVATAGTITHSDYGVRITGKGSGTHFSWED